MSEKKDLELDLADRQWWNVQKLAEKYDITEADVIEVALESALEADLLEERLQLFYN